MADKAGDIKEEVWTHLKDFQYVFLATVEGDQPRVRPVTLIYSDKKFWITTGTENAKVKQIQKNPKTEFCLYLQEKDKEYYVRVAGNAQIIKDRGTKTKIAACCDFFSRYWESIDDPNYTLIEIRPVEIEYLRPGEFLARKFKI